MYQSSKLNTSSHIFQHQVQDYAIFKGQIWTSNELHLDTCLGQRVAIIGIDQKIATLLEKIRNISNSVHVFQIQPALILPQSEHKYNRYVQHPLLIKNKRLINMRIKSILALRFLESQIEDKWLKRQLTPNITSEKKQFLKSDDYYHALQQDKCQLITWPIKKITEHNIECVNGSVYPIDLIITTNLPK